MKVYTKQGDNGMTSLIGGERVFKTDLRVEAYGSVDELTAFTGLLADKLCGDEVFRPYVEQLHGIESQLMVIAALLAVGEGGEDKVAKLRSDATATLEGYIDHMQEQLPAITKFTIPCGNVRLSLSHVCRTVCRRAERAALRAHHEREVDNSALIYLNRLSDYFYLLGRTITELTHSEEILWIP